MRRREVAMGVSALVSFPQPGHGRQRRKRRQPEETGRTAGSPQRTKLHLPGTNSRSALDLNASRAAVAGRLIESLEAEVDENAEAQCSVASR